MEQILVVEDEMIVALDLEHILTSAGYEVVGIAPDTESALAIAPRCTLALVDVNLRDGRTGPQIAREIHQRHGARIVFVTANPEQIGHGAAIAEGFVCKPFAPSAILKAIGRARGADSPGADGIRSATH